MRKLVGKKRIFYGEKKSAKKSQRKREPKERQGDKKSQKANNSWKKSKPL